MLRWQNALGDRLLSWLPLVRKLRADVARYRHAFESTAKDRDRLAVEAESYRHAFESTAKDRDRLALEAAHAPPPQVDDSSPYGRYWQFPTDLHRRILNEVGGSGDLFSRLIETGFVLQHGLIQKRAHIQRLIDCQIEHLRSEGCDLETLDPSVCELAIMPKHLVFQRAGRIISTDLLRFLEYLIAIEKHGLIGPSSTIAEIGAGYGGLARLIKLRHPGARLVLLDIAETLKGAEIYLGAAFPNLTIRYFDPADPTTANSDFVLCTVENTEKLPEQEFDLAINTWSFGEMPNRHIDFWFSFLNDRNKTSALFLTNHFMMPVCLESPTARAQLLSANWLTKIDARWNIVQFQVHPGVHGSPYWRHFQQGVRVVARLFRSDAERQEAMRHSRSQAEDVYLEDWAQFSVRASTTQAATGPSERRAALLAEPDVLIGEGTVVDMAQAETVLGIIKDDLRRDESSAFFRLWNHYRLTGSKASFRLLRVLLYLKWRPAIKNPDTGVPYSVISGEEYQFGSFEDDPNLIVPAWLSRKVRQLFT